MTGVLKLMTMIAVLIVAALALLMIFGVIPAEVFSKGLGRVLLSTFVIALTAVVIGLLARSDK